MSSGLNETPSANRIHIGIFGRRNSGKSSLINAVTGQDISIVSDVPGTTTDPVYKAMEILPLGPVILIDTPGLDDTGELGAMRVKKSIDVIRKCDIAVIVCDASLGKTSFEQELADECRRRSLPFIEVINKSDIKKPKSPDTFYVSAKTGENIQQLKEKLASLISRDNRSLIKDIINPGDLITLVIPIDSAAPQGRIILPQQQVLREILDSNAIAAAVQVSELKTSLKSLGCPSLVITDSQVFEEVSKIVPENIPLTSFSIIFARKKGNLAVSVKGAKIIDSIKNEDTILISEGCTHHRQCDDIGTVKIPSWIRKYTGSSPKFEFSSGTSFPHDLSKYRLIIHCGGCMLNDKEMQHRYRAAEEQNVPITNYGIAIAHIKGILERSTAPFNTSLF